MAENDTREANSGCRWVKSDEYGNSTVCENITAWYELKRQHPTVSEMEIDLMFNGTYCRPCLEGQKIQIANKILSAFYTQTHDPGFLRELAGLIIEKLKISH